ncbi:copper chaperone for superoxide dismutase-like [Lytechinus variegatus]|uniref:copper chaperone for superoxide dismutase-like n=1 Tax=Lytechinus variegatus TaxID=7654 RepID=UPI001BB149D0|nr:copper chaperone for superoxide dismutase-like [Lytechinus variegatus]
MATPSQMEFAVQMTCNSCVEAVKKSLEGIEGIQGVDINLSKEQVIVTTLLPSSRVTELLESTGRRAVLKGQGSNVTGKPLGAAVALLETGESVRGVVRLLQVAQETCIIDGTIDGLSPGKHPLRIHQYGDISEGCASCGNIFDARGILHGEKAAEQKATGYLGEIVAEDNGRSIFRMENDQLKVWDVIGRSMVVGEKSDVPTDIGAKLGIGISCGVIARSAGLFENTKKICACDGITLWDEREVPVAGKERSEFAKKKAGKL